MQKQIVVKSTVGLHASLAAKVVQAASKYSVDINLHYHNKVIDVKSIVIEATGDQAEAAIHDIASILEK